VDGRSHAGRRRLDAVVDSVAMPPEVAATLRAAGYGVRGPAGVGSGGPVWTAVAPPVDGGGADRVTVDRDGADRVVVHALTVPGGHVGDAVLRRLDALRGLDHPHLARVADVLPVSDAEPAGSRAGTVVVLVEEVPGTTLGALLAARAALAPGEVVALTVPLAGALDTLHTAGLAHGDVSPGNVVVRPDGHPVLIDLLGAVDPRAPRSRGRGTPGFVAPEVAAGVPAGAPADVYGLATVALTALDPAAVDGPLGQELTAARARDPVLRPTAGELAAGCFARAVPAPIALPDAGVLARTALAQLAGEGGTVSVDRRSRHRAPRPRRPRARGVLLAAVLLAATAVTGVVVAVLGVLAVADGVTGSARDDATGTAGVRDDARPDPAAAAVDLTVRRVEVLGAGDPAALDDVAAVGSAAEAADSTLLQGLVDARVRLEGLAATGVTAELRPAAGDEASNTAGDPGAASGGRVEVAVTSGLTSHRRVTPDGTVDVPEQPPRTVVLGLVWTPDGWRVDAVREP
jgi:hypothetical protein